MQLIHQAVEAELAGLAGRACTATHRRGEDGGGTQWLSARKRDTNRHWPSDSADPEGSVKDR